jgi:hypothetical protein
MSSYDTSISNTWNSLYADWATSKQTKLKKVGIDMESIEKALYDMTQGPVLTKATFKLNLCFLVLRTKARIAFQILIQNPLIDWTNQHSNYKIAGTNGKTVKARVRSFNHPDFNTEKMSTMSGKVETRMILYLRGGSKKDDDCCIGRDMPDHLGVTSEMTIELLKKAACFYNKRWSARTFLEIKILI